MENIEGVENCIKICNSYDYSMALTSDVFVFTWGNNEYGLLGDGTYENREVPAKVQALSGIIDIAVGSDHCMALSNDGKVYTWGENGHGQLGDGSYTQYSLNRQNIIENHNRNTVYQVEGLSGMIQIAAGYE